MKKVIFISLAILLIAIPATLFYADYFIATPAAQLQSVQQSIVKAKLAQADHYAPDAFRKAENFYDLAIQNWKQTNEHWSPIKDYSLSTYYIDQANFWSLEAIKKSHQTRAAFSLSLTDRWDTLKKKISSSDQKLSRLPYHQKLSVQWSQLTLTVEEGQQALLAQRLNTAETKLKEAEQLFNTIEVEINNSLEDAFTQQPKWNEMISQAIATSKKQSNALIIVDKFAHRCLIYKNGTLLESFDIDLGKNWLGDKNYAGDKTTPEGSYRITKKKSGTETKYHKALLINYPNEEDRLRFNQAKQNGNIPRNKGIGDLIEIHGEGGKNVDWTDGCVALSNADMDRLYSMCSENTPVLIVGSTVPLSQLFTL